MSPVVSRGFRGRPPAEPERLPPGQYLTRDFPVLATGPTPIDAADDWSLTIRGAVERAAELVAGRSSRRSRRRPSRATSTASRNGRSSTRRGPACRSTRCWRRSARAAPPHLVAHCAGGYTTNLPLDDVTGGRAWIAYEYEGEPLSPPHGGPARLLVPHLYFWKSAKWVRELELLDADRPGYWEVNGYHMRGDPWREQRYDDD